MKELFLNVINNRDYELRDILNKIAERHINNDLTDEEKNYLEELARNNANPQNSYAPMEQRLEEAFRRIKVLEDKVFVTTDEPVEDEEQEEEVYPFYKQPLGSHDAYMMGDKITFNDKKYICVMDYCVYDPITYPVAWEEVGE